MAIYKQERADLGTSALSDAPKVELRPNYSKDDVETVIRAVYRQVLGNDYLIQIRATYKFRVFAARRQFYEYENLYAL